VPQIQVARLTARSVRYLEAGQGQPFVLLHSFPLNAAQWTPQLEAVPAGWRFIAPDLSGFGPSAADTDQPRSMARYADDVLELMTHLGIARAGVAGVSMGGYVALALVRTAAARVSALVLADTRPTPDTDDGRAARDRMIAMVEREGMPGLTRDMMPKLVGPTSHRERPEVVATVERLIASNSVPGIRSALLALKSRPDSTSLLPTIACPTLILCGEEDGITPPSDSEAMHRAIRGSRFRLLPRAGHLSNLEAPADFTAALKEFCR
jgi:pimeloyl-ACP methyl ester carboxylesterase